MFRKSTLRSIPLGIFQLRGITRSGSRDWVPRNFNRETANVREGLFPRE
jgi:hypothetical protein